MCIGTNCNGSSLSTYFHIDTAGAVAAPIVHWGNVTVTAAAGNSYPVIVHTPVAGSLVVGQHGCPSCRCSA